MPVCGQMTVSGPRLEIQCHSMVKLQSQLKNEKHCTISVGGQMTVSGLYQIL